MRNRIVLPALVSMFLAMAPAAAQDVITYRDRAAKPEKITTVTGDIHEEKFTGVKIKPTVGPEREIPAGDIIDIVYVVPGAVNIDYKSAMASEGRKAATDAGRKAMEDAEKVYAIVLAKLKDEKTARVQQHLQYKLITIRAFLASGDKLKTLDVIEQLEKFRKLNAAGWQMIAATRQQAQLQIDLENYDSAAKVYEDLLKNPDLAKDVKQETELATIDLLVRAKNYAAAETRIKDALSRLPAADPQAERLNIFLIGCQAATADLKTVEPQLRAIIEKTSDPSLKALAYNTLGDCFNAKGKKDDAKWAYLWVETVYNQDRTELLKALEKLVQVFKDLNDEDHSNKCKEKWARLK
jgi:hypothetical protein